MKNSKLDKIQNHIKNIINDSKRNKIVIGISGGIDSLVALKFFMNFIDKENIYAYYLPIQNHNSFNDVNLISQSLGINITTCDLTNFWQNTINELQISNSDNKLNLKPKIRYLFLSSKAFELNALSVSCLNYDEYYLGYFTKNADGAGDLYPLINFCKEEIYQLAKEWNLPIEIINKKPSADLYENQEDEKDLNLTYKEIDSYLLGQRVSNEVEQKITSLKNKSTHKHTLQNFICKNNGLKEI